jgi:hypothetical protein
MRPALKGFRFCGMLRPLQCEEETTMGDIQKVAAIRRGVLLAVLVALAGCAAAPSDNTGPAAMEPGTGLAFGAFDFRKSDIRATHVVLLRISPTKLYMGGAGERSTVTFTNGEFYAPNLSPGTYAVNAFYSGNTRISLEGNLKNNTFVVEPGRAVYAGTYAVRYERKGVFERDDGAFARVDSRQDERQLLKFLGPVLAGSEWARVVQARLAAVDGGR